MLATKQLPVEVLAELANEFAAGLPARVAVMREAVDEIAKQRSVDAAHRLRLAAHALAGTASAFGATELVTHAERLALGDHRVAVLEHRSEARVDELHRRPDEILAGHSR